MPVKTPKQHHPVPTSINIETAFRYAFLLLLLVFYLDDASNAYARCDIVIDGKANAVIIVSENASMQLESAAKILQRYINASTGALIPILSKNNVTRYQNVEGLSRIWVGLTGQPMETGLNFNYKNGDSFIIHSVSDYDLYIYGATDWGTEIGVYDFLEKYVGIRWLMPGPHGTHVPKKLNLSIDNVSIKEEPAFFSRELSGLPNQTQKIWARYNRMHGVVKFHHNLTNLFPIKHYRYSHPRFFPNADGKLFYPPKDRPWDWQPCFSNPELVDEAVKNITAYFRLYSNVFSYSLGINDSSRFCDEDKPNLNERYFEWANSVVERVLEIHPDKWFGCLAYRAIALPPQNIGIHDRIIPFRTFDRHKWASPTAKSDDMQNTKKWKQKAKVLGWYDYIYGTPYLLPRVYFHLMAEYLRYGFANGVRAIYSEAYPNWGEGPKLYVALRLQWNPNQDVDRLLDDWYVAAVGEEAAPFLKAYYAHWEHFWSKRVPQSEWFDNKGFVRFYSPKYLGLVDYEEVYKSRRLLESALKTAKTETQKARAGLLLMAFEYYETSVVSYLGIVRKKPLSNAPKKFFQDLYKKRTQLIDQFQNHSVLVHPTRFDRPPYKGLRWQ